MRARMTKRLRQIPSDRELYRRLWNDPLLRMICNIDYDREIAIIAELTEGGERKIIGVVRVPIEPDGKTGEIAFIVADPWQGLGLGSKLVDHMIEICKEKGLEKLYGGILSDNTRAIRLMREMGFKVEHVDEETVRATLNLKQELKKQ